MYAVDGIQKLADGHIVIERIYKISNVFAEIYLTVPFS